MLSTERQELFMDKDEAKEIVAAAVAKGLVKYPTVEAAQEAMAVETKPVITEPVKAPEVPLEVEVTSETPQEMEHCQRELIQWAKGKITRLEADHTELNEAYEIAIKNKWKASTLKRHRDKVGAEIIYYQKMLGALEAGYIIVPNMPGAIFVVRTDKVCPSKTWKYYYADAANNKPKCLPCGEGDYISGKNKTERHDIQDQSGKTVATQYKAEEFQEVEFPMALVKPRIMEATTRAMALRIFDEFMILPSELVAAGSVRTTRSQDPIVLGCIRMKPQPGEYRDRRISFMVAWHINSKDL